MDTPGDDILPDEPASEGSSPPSSESAAVPEPDLASGSTLPPESGAGLVESELPPAPPFYRRAAFRRAVVAVGVLVFLFVLGLLLPSPFWRF